MIFLPPKVIQEQYLRPAGLPDELINEIPSPRWVGPGYTNPMFPKPVVEQFVEERRPKSFHKESYGEEEGFKVVAAAFIEELRRLSTAFEKLVSVMSSEGSTGADEEEGDRIYSTAEAAKLLRRHPDVVRQYCRAGDIGQRDASGKWIIRHSDIERFRTRQLVVHGKGVA